MWIPSYRDIPGCRPVRAQRLTPATRHPLAQRQHSSRTRRRHVEASRHARKAVPMETGPRVGSVLSRKRLKSATVRSPMGVNAVTTGTVWRYPVTRGDCARAASPPTPMRTSATGDARNPARIKTASRPSRSPRRPCGRAGGDRSITWVLCTRRESSLEPFSVVRVLWLAGMATAHARNMHG